MRHGTGLSTILVGLALVLAACGGSSTATAAPAATQAPAATSGGEGVATAAPGVASGPTTAPAGGGAKGDACTLITATEAAGVMGVADLTTEATGDGGRFLYCTYAGAGKPIVYMSFMTSGASAVYDAFAGGSDAIAVSGMGDAAVYTPGNGGVLFIHKGDATVGLTVFTELTQAENIELLKKLGAFAAVRM